MKYVTGNRRPRFWSVALLLGSALAVTNVHAGEVLPGGSHTVNLGDPVEGWLVNEGELVVSPGGQTREIDALAGASVAIDGGSVRSQGSAGVTLNQSHAVIDNASIVATNIGSATTEFSFGLNMNGYSAATGGSSAIVRNSTVEGVGRGINAFDGAQITLINSQVRGNSGQDPVGPISGGVGMTLGGSRAVLSGSTVTGASDGVMLLSSTLGSGGASVGSSLVVTDGSSVVGETGSAIMVSSARGPILESTIEVRNGSTLTGGNGVILEVERGALATFNVDNSQLHGDVLVEDSSVANLSLNNNASLTGKITHATSLSIDGSSQWVMEGNSDVGKLALSGGMVDLRGSTPGFSTLTVGELSGAGTFALGTELATRQGDFLEVTGNASGNHQLLVANTGVDPNAGDAPLQVVRTGAGDAQFSLIGDQVDFGTFAYRLEEGQNAAGGSDWSLVQTGKLSNSSRAVVGLFSAAPTVWYGEAATLRSRMGELRNGQDQGGGWIRSYGNKQNISAGGGVDYQQVQHGISFGADMPIASSDGQWLVGLMGGYSRSDLDMDKGTSGKVDSYYVGAYTTWLADDGFYIDALIKANRFQNSSEIRMADGRKAKGKYNNAGVGASVEVGKHIKLEDNWFVEPFAQASGLLVGGEGYNLDNGLRASSNQADSLLGKAGTHLGRTFALEDGGFVQPYVKVAAAREFVNGNDVKINGNRFSNDLSGSRIELGTGVSAQLTDVLQVHAEFDYMKGRHIEQPWGVNVGVRYNW